MFIFREQNAGYKYTLKTRNKSSVRVAEIKCLVTALTGQNSEKTCSYSI